MTETCQLVVEGLMSEKTKKQKALSSSASVDLRNCKTQQCPPEGASTSAVSPQLLKDDNSIRRNASLPEPNITLTQGDYGIISLFDGVSSVVRILKQKLGRSPTAIILAEKDEMLRSLVCAEFGYRSDGQWGYTTDGSACLYIRDVNSILDIDCQNLRQATAMYPNLKWVGHRWWLYLPRFNLCRSFSRIVRPGWFSE